MPRVVAVRLENDGDRIQATLVRRAGRTGRKVPLLQRGRNVERQFLSNAGSDDERHPDQAHRRLSGCVRRHELTLGVSTTASDVDGWDSLAHIRLMLSVERVLKIKLSASEIGRLKSVDDLL